MVWKWYEDDILFDVLLWIPIQWCLWRLLWSRCLYCLQTFRCHFSLLLLKEQKCCVNLSDLKYAHSYTQPISWLLESCTCIIWREIRLEICVEADVWDVAVTYWQWYCNIKQKGLSKIQAWEMVLGGLGFWHSPAQLLIKVFCLTWLFTVSPYELERREVVIMSRWL